MHWETEIGSIWRGFFTSERSLRQSKPKGNGKTFDIRYSGHSLYPMFYNAEFAVGLCVNNFINKDVK